MTTATAQIANHLNIVESVIVEVQEWAHVLFVRFASGRPRFVSKKVVKKMDTVKTVKFDGVVPARTRQEIVKNGKVFSIRTQKGSRRYSTISATVPVGAVVYLTKYTRRGYGKEYTGWFSVTANGGLEPASDPVAQRPSNTSYPHEIYEELANPKNYTGE